MECNGSVPEKLNGSIPTFGRDQKMERNGSILCLVGGTVKQNT